MAITVSARVGVTTSSHAVMMLRLALVVTLYSLATSSQLVVGAQVSLQQDPFVVERYVFPTRQLLADAVPAELSLATSKYFSNTELENHLKDFGNRCNAMARVFSLGTSVQGTTLWAVELANQSDTVQPKPNFKYVANMHGDEPSGRQLLVALAEWLCASWRSNAEAARLVNDMRLYLVPTINPDGFAAKQRGNSNGADLNRDFPDPIFGLPGLAASGQEQPETQAIMRWSNSTRFVAGAQLHEGAVVANYPWDGTLDRQTHYAASPDDATFRYLARVYSKAHSNMASSREFEGGITNGAAWYPLWGGMQDWNYVGQQCMELTLELSQDKHPAEASLQQLWADNQAALVALPLAAALGGLRGVVREAPGGARGLQEVEWVAKGKPLPGSIAIEGVNHTIAAGAEYGDFYRPLAPGQYTVTASLRGYESISVPISVPADATGVVHNFDLVPLPPLGGAKQQADEPVAAAEASIAAKQEADKAAQEDGGVVTRLPRKFGPGEEQGVAAGKLDAAVSQLEEAGAQQGAAVPQGVAGSSESPTAAVHRAQKLTAEAAEDSRRPQGLMSKLIPNVALLIIGLLFIQGARMAHHRWRRRANQPWSASFVGR